MAEREFLTVAEYAALKGISKQRVYQLLNKGLKDFVKEVEGKKVIDITALSDAELEALEQGLKPDLNKLKQEVEQGVESPQTELQLLKQTLDLLSAQIEIKDKLIEDLRQAGEEKDKHIQEQAHELTRLLSQSQELQRNNQILLAQKTALEEGKPEEEKQEEQPIEAKPEKRSFWKRWFN